MVGRFSSVIFGKVSYTRVGLVVTEPPSRFPTVFAAKFVDLVHDLVFSHSGTKVTIKSAHLLLINKIGQNWWDLPTFKDLNKILLKNISHLTYFSSPLFSLTPVGRRKSPIKILVLNEKCSRRRFFTPFFSRYWKTNNVNVIKILENYCWSYIFILKCIFNKTFQNQITLTPLELFNLFCLWNSQKAFYPHYIGILFEFLPTRREINNVPSDSRLWIFSNGRLSFPAGPQREAQLLGLHRRVAPTAATIWTKLKQEKFD